MSGLLPEHPWRLTYSTSSQGPGGRPVDILHDFYLPALARSVRYDRVAGYFRSSSLAAASQGFSAFVAGGGRARMVVGADLDPADVRAVLEGTEAHLAAALNRELAGVEGWPEDVQSGVRLLAWMVANGHLEVRVAFRMHGGTGAPLAVDSRADGYVHEKWAVFADATGTRIYVSGSFNESRTALVRNAENIEVHRDWTSEENRQRADAADQRFERVWSNQSPSLRVMSLPEAVRQRLIAIAEGVTRPIEIDGTSALPLEVPPPSAAERLRFALLRDGPRLPGGRYVGLVTAPIAPWPHQAVVARRLIDSWPFSYLLCDEVGLGKTIEAGLVIRSLYLSGLARRVLISPPASLTRQWQREMASKFYLPFARAVTGLQTRHEYLLPVEEVRSAESLYGPDLAIVSTGLLARQNRRRELQRAPDFDIALVDEAHYARRSNPTGGAKVEPRYGHLYETLLSTLRGKARCLYLATATPMQLDVVEVADLVRLTQRVGPFLRDPTLLAAYYEQLGRLVRGERVDDHGWAFLRRAVLAIERQDPLLWAYLREVVTDALSRFDVDNWIERDLRPVGYSLEGVRRLIFAASPLSRVMLRHTRPLLEVYRQRGKLSANLATRIVLPLQPVRFTAQEDRAYAELEKYCEELARRLGSKGGKKRPHSVGFYLSFLRLRFASSLFAIRETLRRRAERVQAALAHLVGELPEEPEEVDLQSALDEGEDDAEAVESLLKDRTPEDLRWEKERVTGMLAGLEDLSGPSSKMQRLLEYLNTRRLPGGRLRQTVVFTRFYDTLTDIVDRLRRADRHLLIGTYSGEGGGYVNPRTWQMTGVERDEVKHRFLRGDIDVLVCTDAAAEGLNLQTADWLVNFDLPWNPMKVEQRIGRIDRIGQRHPTIYVCNLCYLGSAEEVVYGRLLARLTDAGYVVGTQQLSLLPVTQEEFRELAEGVLTEEALSQTALERAALQRARTESMEIPARELFEIYSRIEEQAARTPVPVDLEAIWHTLASSRYLQDLGCTLLADPALRAIELRNVPDVPDGTLLTTSRETFEKGLPDREGVLHFATYGDPVFDTLLAHVGRFALPASVRRITVAAPTAGAETVGYAVLEGEGPSQPAARLVTSVADADTVRVSATGALDDAAQAPLAAELARQVRADFDRIGVAARIEQENLQAGTAQLTLALLLAHSLMAGRQRLGHGLEKFWPELNALSELVEDRDAVRVSPLPAQTLRRLSGLLFDPVVPQVGETGHLDAPRLLLECAFDAAARVADALHVAKAELTVEEVQRRIEREVASLSR